MGTDHVVVDLHNNSEDGGSDGLPTDADLLAAHVAGDDQAFGLLFQRHRARLWAVALRTCSDPELASDGLQEGMIAAFRRAETFRGESQVTTWLHRIVVNACLDRLRAAKVRAADPLPEDVDRAVASAPVTPEAAAREATADPARRAEQADRRQVVLHALRELTPEQRAAVVLVDMEGYSVAETAEILGCAEGTVKSRCARARAKLAPLLADLLHDATDRPHDPDEVGNQAPRTDVGSVTRRGPPASA